MEDDDYYDPLDCDGDNDDSDYDGEEECPDSYTVWTVTWNCSLTKVP